MGVLNLDNIVDVNEIDSLFNESEETTVEEKKESTDNKKEKETIEEEQITNLFDDIPESVDSKENIQEKEDTESTEESGSSPNNSIYSSIAKDLKADGVFLDLEDTVIDNIKTSEDLYNAIEEHIKTQLDERQRRVDDALNYGIEPTEIQKYEKVINYLSIISEDAITAEDEKGEKLRRDLIYQDFLNKGFTPERAKRETDKSFTAGTDVDDAKEALNGNKEYYKQEYDNLIKAAKKEAEDDAKEAKENAVKLQKSIMEDKTFFGDLSLSKTLRVQALNNITKPIYKDPKTGESLTALQKYEQENKLDFLKNIGIIYTLTDGFKNLNGLIQGKVNKEVKKGQRELERTINNTQRNNDGSLNFSSGVSDSNSYIGIGFDLDA